MWHLMCFSKYVWLSVSFGMSQSKTRGQECGYDYWNTYVVIIILHNNQPTRDVVHANFKKTTRNHLRKLCFWIAANPFQLNNDRHKNSQWSLYQINWKLKNKSESKYRELVECSFKRWWKNFKLAVHISKNGFFKRQLLI